MKLSVTFSIAASVIFCLLARLCVAGETISVSPRAIDDVLLNPGKGWIAYGLPDIHPPEVLALCSTGYDRLEWQQLEPAEGTFNWKPIDERIAAWKKAGKQFAFGVMCLNSSDTAPGGYTTPKWVFDAGAKFKAVDLKSLANQYAGSPGVRIVPDFVDPIFLAKQKAFLIAMAARYDGSPDLAFIDIRAYGNWGENHMYPFGIPDISPAQYRAMIQVHLDLFHKTRLEMSAGNDHFNAALDWAAGQGIGIRRDGIVGNSDGSECARCLGKAPAVFEFFGSYTWMKKQGWWDGHRDQDGNGHRLIECVENGKPSYIGMSQWDDAKNLLAADKPLIEKLANRMGYHIALAHAEFPQTLVREAPADFKFDWRNSGVAPIYVPCALAIALLDGHSARDVAPIHEHRPEVVYPVGSTPATWLGEATTTETVRCAFTRAQPGKYRLAVALVADGKSTTPIIKLANTGRTATGWYVLGDVELR